LEITSTQPSKKKSRFFEKFRKTEIKCCDEKFSKKKRVVIGKTNKQINGKLQAFKRPSEAMEMRVVKSKM